MNKIPKEYKEFGEDLIIPRAFLGTSIQFLRLVESVLEETLKKKNIHAYFGDEITDVEFDNLTRWSDFNVIRPVLFNFYHGIELLIKGILLISNPKYKLDHNLEQLWSEISKIDNIPSEIKAALDRHINPNGLPEPMKKFLKQNNLTISQLYEYLRYPTNKQYLAFPDYDFFEYQGKSLIPYLKSLKKDSHDVRVASVQFIRERKNK